MRKNPSIRIARRIDSALGPFLDDGARIMFFMFSAAALVICLLYQLLAVPHPYSLDYGEAPLVDQAMRLAAGQNVYRADLSTPPYTISNYPPLYITILAFSVKIFGPAGTFFVGRILSALCTWASAIFLFLIVYSSTRDGVFAIYVANSDGSEARKLTDTDGSDEDGRANFSPDGSKIVFTRRHAGSMDIYLLPLHTVATSLKQLTDGGQ